MTDTSKTDDVASEGESIDGRPPERSPDGQPTAESDDGWRSFDENDVGDGDSIPVEDSSDVVRALAWAALVVLSLLAVVALIGFYRGIGLTIDRWIDPAYQPIASAAFNLVVLLASLVGVSLVVRELA